MFFVSSQVCNEELFECAHENSHRRETLSVQSMRQAMQHSWSVERTRVIALRLEIFPMQVLPAEIYWKTPSAEGRFYRRRRN